MHAIRVERYDEEANVPTIRDGEPLKRKQTWHLYIGFGMLLGTAFMALVASLLFVVDFLLSAGDIAATFNAMGIMGGAAYIGVLGGAIGVWAVMQK